ncbi:MAG TPA: pitrilysin family protein [Candidatus Paceibacterota bacterium]|nr:pitrilysin family protein [Candidatus Paceibacterota bacterium]
MEFIKKNLNNGAVLYVLPMLQANSVASGVLIKVGSQDEKMPQEAGLAHAVEHLLIQGTERFPDKKSLAEFIEEVGGIKNGRTSKESTFIYNQVPQEEFERSIIVLSEQIQNSLFKSERVESETKVIVQEIHRAHDTPGKMAYERTFEHIFKNHPLGHMGLGNKESVLSFKREDLLSFMDKHYYPSNYVFIVVGNVVPEKAEELINKYFPKGKDRIEESENKKESFKFPDDKEYIERMPFNQAHIRLAAPIESASEKEKFCLIAFSIMASSGSSSPLYDEIRTKRGLCYSIGTAFYAGNQEGLFIVAMATAPDKYQEAIDSALMVLENTKKDHIRFEKSKKRKMGSLALNNENPLNVLLGAESDITFFGRPFGYEELKSITESLTLEDIEKTVDKYLKREQFYKILLLPQ